MALDEQNCLACLFSSYALGTVGVDNGGFDFITLREEIATRVIRGISVAMCMVAEPC